MDLAEYQGATPEADASLTVDRVTHHRRWSPADTAHADCPNCGDEFDLSERHVLVTLAGGDVDDEERRYVCSASCVDEWLEG